MPKYRLTYFPIRLRAEAIRMILFINGVEFEDVHVGVAEEWQKVKDTFPLKQVPILEVDDVVITQTRAILRYLGREFAYYGTTNLVGAQIDCFMDVCDDVIKRAASIYDYQGPGSLDKSRFVVDKKDVMENYTKVIVADLLGKLQTLYEMNKTVDGFCVGDELTIADMYYFAAFDFVEIFTADPFAGFPKMEALFEKIKAHKKVSEWLRATEYGTNPMDLLKEKRK